MLTDYQESATRIQTGLGRAFLREPFILNIPGRSIAMKIDPLYYLVIMPGFAERMAREAGMLMEKVQETLVKTGNFITAPPERDPVIPVGVNWGAGLYEIRAAFLEADFVDRGLRMYGGLDGEPGLAELRISSAYRPALDALFEGKTPLRDFVFF